MSTDIMSPAGRLVQGMLRKQQRKDMATNQLLWLDEAKTIPDLGVFFSVAFPKLIDGQPNPEFGAMWQSLSTEAMNAWPQFFAQGQCTNPSFSWKYQDGDGSDKQGKNVADKPGFKGHHIIKFDTSYDVRAFYEGKYSPQEEIGIMPNTPAAWEVIKRGYWLRVFFEAKTNNADISKRQVPGLALYPKLVAFLGGRPEDEIKSGPDAQEVFGKAAAPGWRPGGISAVPGAPVGGGMPSPGAALPLPGGNAGIALPGPGVGAPVATLPNVTPLPGAPGVSALPGAAGGGLPRLPGLPGMPGAAPTPPAQPQYAVRPDLAQQGYTIAGLMQEGWTLDALAQQGYVTRIG